MSLISELKRRNVLRMAAGYLAVSWLLVQVVETLIPVFGYSENAIRLTAILLAVGFIPALVLSWVFEWTPEGLVRDAQSADTAVRAKSAKTWDRVILVVLAAAVGLFAFERFIITPEREAALVEAATEAGIEMGRSGISGIPDKSVAVLPFANMSANPENEYFSDGLTDTLLHMLAQLSDLHVAARTSSFAFKDKNDDIRTIADALSVAHVLEGSVQRSGDRVRVTAQLIRANDGYHVWSQNYDRNLDDIFAIQDEIATDVAIALGSSLLAPNSGAVASVSTTDIAAYDLYLRGLEQFFAGVNSALLESDRLLGEAIEKDPEFTEARLALVRNLIQQMFVNLLDYEEGTSEAEQLIGEILEDDPDNAAARQVQAVLNINRVAVSQMDMSSIDQLVDELVSSFDDDGGSTYARRVAAQMLAGIPGKTDEALALLRRALVTDPLNIDLLTAQLNVLQSQDRYHEAKVPLQTLLEIAPDNPMTHYQASQLELSQGNYSDSLLPMKQHALLDVTAPPPAWFLAYALDEVGLHEESDRWYALFRSRSPEESFGLAASLWSAIFRDDSAAFRVVVEDWMDRVLKKELDMDGIAPLALNFAILAYGDGKTQEALEYIESYYPGISDLDTFEGANWEEVQLQYYGVIPLLLDVNDEEGDRRLVENMIEDAKKFGLEVEDFDDFYLFAEYYLNGIDAGRSVFHERFADTKRVLHVDWTNFLRIPWLAELRDDPEVAAAIAVRNARVAEIREEMRAVIEQPDWRDDTL